MHRGGDIYDIHFSSGKILTADIKVAAVPAAVWLFGFGLLGLAGIARHKS